ncbi:MAG: GerMN domain-containing protein [Clostridia bacterium]|nr:GerMN domain-containing protein [Clostridia bacterium]
MTMLLSGCSNGNSSKTITLYFPSDNDEGEAFITSEIEVTSNDKIVLLDSVKDALLEGPAKKDETYKNIYSDIVSISYVTLENKLLIVNLTGDYYALSPSERLSLKAGIAKSYANFRFVESLRFLKDGNMLLDDNGKQAEDILIENLLTEMDDVSIRNDFQTYSLYFANEKGTLTREERTLEVQTSTLLAKALIEELMAGPMNENLMPTIPKGTRIRQLEIKEGICYVDFNKNFQSKHSGGENEERLTIYSLVNTLTELTDIEKVQFLIDGEKVEDYQGYIDFSQTFSRDESIISQITVKPGKQPEKLPEVKEEKEDDEELTTEKKDENLESLIVEKEKTNEKVETNKK